MNAETPRSAVPAARQRGDARSPAAGRYGRRRAVVLAGVYLAIGLHIAHWRLTGRTLAPLEFNEVVHTLHDGIVTAGFLFMAIAVVATAVVGRFFCSWGCHILALEDLAAWVLARVGIRPRPVRARSLAWVPGLTLAYLVVWPLLVRLWRGAPAMRLRVVDAPGGWGSFVTTDFWRNLPGPGMSALTFAVCGFVIVYLLGSRSFCRYVCPYGAAFALADRVAPGRIVASGDCSRCGLCTAVCQSQVRVQAEVGRYGMVVSPDCLKDLDCVAACPTGALGFGFARPPAFAPGTRRMRHPYGFSAGEEAVMSATFVVAAAVLRGLYDAVGLLLALALAAIAAYVAVIALRLVRDERVRSGGGALKYAGRLTARGVAFAVCTVAAAVFLAHSAVVRYHVVRGEWLLDALASRGALPTAATAPSAAPAAVRTALHHLEAAAGLGLVRPVGLRRALAAVRELAGDGPGAERELRLLVATAPDDRAARFNLGQLLLRRGDAVAARAELAQVADDASARTPRELALRGRARATLARLAAAEGRRAEATELAAGATRDLPDDGATRLLLGRLLADAGRLDEAESALRDAAVLDPASAAAHNDLAVVLTRRARHAEAVAEYRASLALRPDDARVHQNLGTALYDGGDLDAAIAAFGAALDLAPDAVDAHVGIAMALRRRGDLMAARSHWQRAAALDDRYARRDLP